jgi:putative membrane protein
VGLAPHFTATILVCLAISACGPRDDTMSDTMEAAADTAAAPGLSDAQIAHVAVTASSIDSGFGEMALTKAQSQSVKDFAQTMITDHGAVNKQAVDLATRLNVTPMENDISGQLQSGADQARPAIENLTGAAFDSAYIAREVQYHQTVVDALNQTLIPGTQNAELKSLLESARPAFVAHLERARQIQGTLSGT